MKKSRIIVPALAMLTLSVAASVTGTVAWFTASRTASISLSNLAAFNTSGDLDLVLEKGNQTSAANNSGSVKTLTLQPMRDASYDVSHANNGTNPTDVYYGLLNNDGNKVIKTVAATSPNLQYGTFGGKDVYFANYFTGTFNTKSVNASYLYFNNNKTKSFVEGYSTLDTESIYRALRVSMEAKSIKGESSSAEETKTIVWAPYTNEETVYNLCKAGTLTTPVNASGEFVDIAASYKEGATPLAKKTEIDPIKVVKISNEDEDPVDISTNATDAINHSCLLSSKLVHNADSNLKVKVVVKFTIWFEGLDPVCVNSAKDLNTFVETTAKALNMGFYAIDSTLFAPAA